MKKSVAYSSVRLESQEIAKLERDLLTFLLVASFEDKNMFGAIFKLLRNFRLKSQTAQDIDFDIRCDKLAENLYACGIPAWIAQRNARAFMTLRPDFDLDSPKHRRIKKLLEYHQDEFLNAYFSVEQLKGRKAADAWAKYIRESDIFFARIASFADDLATRYLVGC